MKRPLRPLRFVTAMWLLSSGLPPASAAAGSVPDATRVPPAPMVDQPLAPPANDVPEERPGSQHVWVPGHWSWSEGAYVWETGRWQVPPGPNLVWQAPQWQRAANGYTLREGGWVAAGQALPPAAPVSAPAPVPVPTPAPVPAAPTPAPAPAPSQPTTVVVAPTPAPQVIVMAPPPPRREMMHGRPSPYHVWVPGFWSWRGNRYVWIAGHFALPPRGRHTWVEPRWERRSGVYVFIEGRWR